MALVQITSTPIEPATLLFNHPIRGIMPILTRPPHKSNNDKEHYEASIKTDKMIRTMILPETMLLFQKGLL